MKKILLFSQKIFQYLLKFVFAHDTISLKQKLQWEVFVIQDEFYRSSEYKEITEYQHFPAESYLKPTEENSVGVEQSNLGKEITTLQASPKKKSTNKQSSLLDKVFNSIKSCGVAASVAVVAVVGSTTLVGNPTAQFVSVMVESTYVEYQLSVEELDEQNNYAVVVSTANEEVSRFPIEEDGLHENKVEGLKPQWEYTLAFVRTDEFLGDTVLLKETFQTKPEAPPNELPQPPPDYQLSVYNVQLAGLNEANVFFTHENLDENSVPELVISYDNGEQATVTLGSIDLIKGYARVSLDGTFTSVTVTPIVRVANSDDVLTFEAYNHTFEQTLDAKVIVNTSNKTVTFLLNALTSVTTRVQLVDNGSGEIVYDNYLFDSYVIYYYTTPSEPVVNYTISLVDDDGQKVTNDFSTTVDTSFSAQEEFQFQSVNPGDVGITYNEDGTINIYIPTQFQTDNPNLYYQVRLGSYVFTSRDAIFEATGLPDDDTYPITYDVLIDVDGVSYSVYNVSPSGAANEFGLNDLVDSVINGNTVELSVMNYYVNNVDLGSVKLQTSSGEEVVIDEASWMYDEENQRYYVEVQFANEFDYFDIFARCNQSKLIMEQIPNYVGSVDKEITNRIYKQEENT